MKVISGPSPENSETQLGDTMVMEYKTQFFSFPKNFRPTNLSSMQHPQKESWSRLFVMGLADGKTVMYVGTYKGSKKKTAHIHWKEIVSFNEIGFLKSENDNLKYRIKKNEEMYQEELHRLKAALDEIRYKGAAQASEIATKALLGKRDEKS